MITDLVMKSGSLLSSEEIESRRAYHRAWEAKNKGKIAASKKADRIANPDKYKARQAAWRAANIEKKRAYDAVYTVENRERIALSAKANKAKRFAADPKGAWIARMLTFVKYRCKQRGMPFELTAANFPECPDVCPVLGCALDYSLKADGIRTDLSPSIDRIKPALGYVIGNVAIISMRANRIKSDASSAEIYAVADYARRNGY